MTIDRVPATHSLRTQRARPLAGTIVVSGDPQIAARALIVGAMAQGESRLRALRLEGEAGIVATAVQALGARLEDAGDHHLLSGLGSGGLLDPRGPLLLFGAEDAAPLLYGAAGIYPFPTRFAPTIPPTPELAAALEALGIVVREVEDGLVLHGPRLAVPTPCPAGSAAAADAVLLAGVATAGTTTALGVPPGPDHTMATLAAFGAKIGVADRDDGLRDIAIEGLPDLRAIDARIPGEPGRAALWLIAGSIVSGSRLTVENVLLNPWRAGLLQVLLDMGADIRVVEQTQVLGEEVADLMVRHAPLSGTTIDAETTAMAEEVLPFLVLAAAYASGDTVFEGYGALVDKAGWKGAMTRGLSANGVAWEEDAGRLIVHGHGRVSGGGLIPAHRDGRIPLMFLMMGMSTRDPITIVDGTPIETRFPGVLAALIDRGASFKKEGVA